MNKFEFTKTMKEIHNAYPSIIEKIDDETYTIANLKIENVFDYCTKIKGKIPLVVAEYIYNTYPTERKYIRANGNTTEEPPSSYAMDDLYLKEIEINFMLKLDEYQRRRKEARENMLARSNEHKYINSYHIDYKDDLIIFITELVRYLKIKNSLKIDIIDIEEMIYKVNQELLSAINPNITMEEWIHQQLIENALRRKIIEFDHTVNPFITNEIDKYLSDRINIDYNKNYSDSKKESTKVEIIRDNNIRYGFERSHYGYMYYLKALINSSPLKICHYHTNRDTNQLGTGEIIAIDKLGQSVLFNNNIDLYYNLDQNICGTKYGSMHPITEKEKRIVDKKLTEGIELVKESKPYTLVKKK